MAACVAVVGTSDAPLFIKNYTADEDLKFHSLVHVSLDAFDEKARAERSNLSKNSPADSFYLGLLYPTEDYSVYGYLSSTCIKFVLILGSPLREAVKDDTLRAALQQLHIDYVASVMNPFAQPDAEIVSDAFEAAADEIANGIVPGPPPMI